MKRNATGATKYGAYDLVHDIAKFMKRKRKTQYVILAPNLLPRDCAVCGRKVEKNDSNFADLKPIRAWQWRREGEVYALRLRLGRDIAGSGRPR